MTEDAYSEEALKLQGGDRSKTVTYSTDEDGHIVGKLKDKGDPSRLSGRYKKAVRECPDDAIRRMSDNSLAIYFTILTVRRVTVSRRGNRAWLCHSCRGPDGSVYMENIKKGCCHILRVSRWYDEHDQQVAA